MVRKGALFFITLAFLTSFVFASPVLTVHSPENTTYNQQKILINVSSTENVDFYIKNPRTNYLVRLNSTTYESFLYGKTGNFNLTIFANNSNGNATQNIYFSLNISNPINITDCGELISPNAQYQLMNNLSGIFGCVSWREEANNITLDLNGFTIQSNSGHPITSTCFFSEIKNGTINYTGSNIVGALDIQAGDSCLFKNLTIESTFYGITPVFSDRMKFENVNIIAPTGVFIDGGDIDLYFKKVNFLGSRTGNGNIGIYHDSSFFDTVILEEVNFTNYTEHATFPNSFKTDYIIRNTHLNFSNDEPNFGFIRFIEQHLAVIELTDILGNPISGAVEIVEDDFNLSNPPALEKIDSNPTAHVFTATNSSGIAEVFLTGEMTIKRTFSPSEIQTIAFNNYNLTARSKGLAEEGTINFTESNSTVNVNISIDFSSDTLPKCTISQMLDLDNNGVVNIHDSLIVTKYAAGQSITQSNVSKNCEGINFLN